MLTAIGRYFCSFQGKRGRYTACIAIAKSHIPNLHKSHTNRAYVLNANVQIIFCRKKETAQIMENEQ